MDDQTKKDLLMALGFITIIFLIWIFTGGPSRPTATSGPFIKTLNAPQFNFSNPESKNGIDSASIYKNKASIGSSSPAKEKDPQKEYVEIRTSSNNKEPVNISSWYLENKNGEKLKIGQAATLPLLGEINIQQDILLKPGEKVIVATGWSPIGTNFQINKCIGYFSQMQDFYPKLSDKCPDPIKDEVLPASLDNACIDYINREFKLCTAYITLPANLSNNCKEYINERINYNGCIVWHKKNSDFYKPEYRVYLKKDSELWNNEHEKIILYDDGGKIIDWISY